MIKETKRYVESAKTSRKAVLKFVLIANPGL